MGTLELFLGQAKTPGMFEFSYKNGKRIEKKINLLLFLQNKF
jgi:hypothetical protein